MKKILLLVPKMNGPGNGRKLNAEWPDALEKTVNNSLWKVATPGVLTLASMCDKSKFHIDLIDEEFQEVNLEIQYDIAAMYTVTPNAKRTYKFAEYYRSKGTYVVLGGVHAVVCQDEAENYADTLLLGEGEKIWPEFLEDFCKGKPKNKYFQPLGKINVNESPIPAFELLPLNGRKIIPIQTARGCPHGCKFCNLRSIYGKGYRAKNIENVDKELKEAFKINPKSSIYFTDDNLLCHKERSKKLIDVLKSYNVTWYSNSDISFSDDADLLKEAYKSGCRQVLVGFESINPANLIHIDENDFKSRRFLSYKEAINKIQSNGIGVIGSFIIGLDEDNKDVFESLFEFISETNLYGANVTVNTPYPGTEIFEKVHSENRILTYDWDKYTIFQPVISPKRMSIDELNNGYSELLQKINSSGTVIKRIKYFKERLKKMEG